MNGTTKRSAQTRKGQLLRAEQKAQEHIRNLRAQQLQYTVYSSDPGDKASTAQDKTENEAELAIWEESRLKIKAALAHANAGKDGICEDCGEPIHPDRLNVIPETTLCAQCQKLKENSRRSVTLLGR